MKQVDIGLSQGQSDFFYSKAKRSLLLGGWGSGKTLIGAFKAALKSAQHPETVGLIAANTNKQLHRSTLSEYWKVCRQFFGWQKNVDYVFGKMPPPKWNVESRYEDHKGIITFRWGAQVLVSSLVWFRLPRQV